jgi:cyclopropane fatty-acyl-phospholipid synthase-like methyltransferase
MSNRPTSAYAHGMTASLWPRIRRVALGLAHDFWQDGPALPPPNTEILLDPAEAIAIQELQQPSAPATPLWHAQPGEISEKIWGQGFVTPGDEYLTELMIKPLGINKDMSVLDLSAGLGGRLRRVSNDFGIYITGLEPDPEIAKRGMQLSIAAGMAKRAEIKHADLMNLELTRAYDCFVMRETMYRLTDKQKLVTAIAKAAKMRSQLSFTDYIVNPEDQDKPAIVAWKAFEKATPMGLVEMAQLWAKAGFNLRVHDDQTDYYKKEVMAGLRRFSQFLAASYMKPAEETKKSIDKRITTWAHRLAAMEEGMKFYRFYGLK